MSMGDLQKKKNSEAAGGTLYIPESSCVLVPRV